jgi:hypothetical protein
MVTLLNGVVERFVLGVSLEASEKMRIHFSFVCDVELRDVVHENVLEFERELVVKHLIYLEKIDDRIDQSVRVTFFNIFGAFFDKMFHGIGLV